MDRGCFAGVMARYTKDNSSKVKCTDRVNFIKVKSFLQVNFKETRRLGEPSSRLSMELMMLNSKMVVSRGQARSKSWTILLTRESFRMDNRTGRALSSSQMAE